MTKITTFIKQEVLIPRLKLYEVLVVYDPEHRYRELCLELASEKYQVIDATESSITSRFKAQSALVELGMQTPDIKGILVYVPSKPPITDEEKQRDPFAVYGVVGALFPEGDGDEFLSVCLKARPDHVTEIRQVFASNPKPSFDVIDAIGVGASWPNLQTLLNAESARSIIFALLAPNELQKTALNSQKSWISECAGLFQSYLGFTLKTKLKTWEAISDKLWRFLLFSEFVYDLPGDPPAALGAVPCGPQEARVLVFDLCDQLRNDIRTQAIYAEMAKAIENALNLPVLCTDIDDFGERDTFPFEERACFTQAVVAIKQGDTQVLNRVFQRHEASLWAKLSDNPAQWTLLGSATKLSQVCDEVARQLSAYNHELSQIIEFYVTQVCEVDRLQREFEQSAADLLEIGGAVDEVIRMVRVTYRKLMEKLQAAFLSQIEKSGWPVLGRLSTVEIFDTLITPKLRESGRRVAFIQIDALRYELGLELSKQLAEFGQVDLSYACASIPTITTIGMASLLPGAGKELSLLRKEDNILPAMGDQLISTVGQRMDVFRKIYGTRFEEKSLGDFVKGRTKIESRVELLVLRSNDMDNDFESNPEAAPGLISRTLQKVRLAVAKLRDQGFADVIIGTDHGFFLNTNLEPGDICTKPSGKWINIHERTLLGDGVGDPANLVLPAMMLGIKGDINQVAVPRALVSYRAGLTYFHGGLSLQEAIVPVLSLKIKASQISPSSKMNVVMSYKQGAKKITTRRPVIELIASSDELFPLETDVLIEAYDLQGNVVGEVKLAGTVNPTTGIITLKPGDPTIQVTMRMADDYEGKFIIKALDPNTQAALGNPLELETDYMV